MPYVGEHSARINPPSKYTKFRRQNNKFGPGIHVIFGITPEGQSEVQAIRFDSEKYTTEQAKEWLKEHDYKAIEFEEAISEEQAKEMARKPGQVRILGIELPAQSTFDQSDDGSLTVRNVPLLASGIWTDSAVGTPLEYPPRILEQYATNWKDTSHWSRHLGGTPRDITEKIGEIKNPRYENGVIYGDVHYHGLNERSRDTIRMVLAAREGKISMPYVSVEHGGSEIYNPQTRRMEAKDIVFYGSATVNQGACRKCRLHQLPEIEPETPQELDIVSPTAEKETFEEINRREQEAHQMELKEFEEKFTEIQKELEASKARAAELEAKVKALESAPVPPETKEVKELEENFVVEQMAEIKRGNIRRL